MDFPEAVTSGSATVNGAPHVLQVVGSLNIGGAEMMMLAAAEALGARCRMDFLVFGEQKGALEPRALSLGARVLRIPAPRDAGRPAFFRALKDLLRRERYDAVHSHVNLASGGVMRAARSAGVPIRIAHSHTARTDNSSAVRRAYGWLARREIIRYATVLAACGEEAGQNLFGHAWSGERAVTLANGVAVDTFLDARDQRDATRARLGLSGSRRVIGAIGRLVRSKNHRFLIDVIEVDRSLGGDLRLVIVGEGVLRRELEEYVTQKSLGDRVQFLGLRTDVPDILGMLDVLAMPSEYEGLPVALIEAQASGTAVVMSDRITRESDLGLGLMRRLPVGDALPWVTALNAEFPLPEPVAIRERFLETGYEVRASADRLRALYMPRRGERR